MSTPKRRMCPTEKVEDRLKFFSDPVASGCIEWNGSRHRGYGLVSTGNGGQRRAHIVAWELSTGQTLPEGMVIRHTCDNPPCINPDHLLLGTNADNANDMVERNRSLKGELAPRAKLTDNDVRQIRVDLAAGATQKSLADRYGVNQVTIGCIKLGKTWKHVK